MRKYICDNCGAEFETDELFALKWMHETLLAEEKIGEFCRVCMEKIKARIQEGVQ